MRNYKKKELALIWLDSFIGLEYKHKRNLYESIEQFDGITEFLSKGKDYIIGEIGEKEYNNFLTSANKIYLDYVLKELDDENVEAVTIESDDYPEQLLNITCPPMVLYLKGDKSLLSSKCFSIVGSRKSLPLSINIAKNFSTELAKRDFTLVTGIAEGVDSTVIESALNNGGKVISVIAGGFNNIYPKSNMGLFEKVTKMGLAVSENPPDTISKPYFFPIRNRIIAGLSKGTLIISGGKKSGTLYTAEYAEEFNRDLFAVPYSVGVACGEGCNDLIKRGAILTDAPSDILEFYGESAESDKSELNPEEDAIIKALSEGELHIEKLCTALNKQVQQLTATLSIMEIKGMVYKNGNFYGVVKK